MWRWRTGKVEEVSAAPVITPLLYGNDIIDIIFREKLMRTQPSNMLGISRITGVYSVPVGAHCHWTVHRGAAVRVR